MNVPPHSRSTQAAEGLPRRRFTVAEMTERRISRVVVQNLTQREDQSTPETAGKEATA